MLWPDRMACIWQRGKRPDLPIPVGSFIIGSSDVLGSCEYEKDTLVNRIQSFVDTKALFG